MWSWLKKLMNNLLDSEQDHQSETSAQSTTRQPQARTKSIYPRERERERQTSRVRVDKERVFRFPVIPDQKSTKRKEETVEESKPLAYQPKMETAPRKKADDPQVQEKRAFTPMEVISPIYGKLKEELQDRPRKTEIEQREREQADDREASHGPAKVTASETARDIARETARETVGENESEQWRRPLDYELLLGKTRQLDRLEEQRNAEARTFSPAPDTDNAYRDHFSQVEHTAANDNQMIEEELSSKLPETVEQPLLHTYKEEEELAAEIEEQLEVNKEFENEDEIEPKIEPKIKSSEEYVSVIYDQTAATAESPAADEAAPATVHDVAPATVHDVAPATVHNVAPATVHDVAPATVHDVAPATVHHVAPATMEAKIEPTSLFLHNWKQQSKPAVAATDWSSQQLEQSADPSYAKPALDLLNPSPQLTEDYYEYTLEQKQLLEDTLVNFNVSAQVVGIVKGPSVTRFELQPAPGVKVNKITGLTDDIKLNLAAKDIRIEAPIPGRNAVGIEVPNIKSEPIFISRIIGSDKFQEHASPMAIALGMDIGGEPIVADIKKMPHGLIAGSTGSGKSVCINSIIVSLLYKATPEQVRLLLIDPKMVELAPYNNLPHLVTPVVTDAKQATAALKWAVEEMEKRYALFVDAGVRDIDRYNLTTDEPLPYIVIIIDELADLMMVSPQDVEDSIIRIAQKARACGIHLLLATQRPSVDVITGNIKANVPTRLAFAVFSQVDSRTILDQSGAERLLGRGDMLFLESGATPVRLQGNYVSDDEIERVTQMIKKQRKPEYLFSREDLEQSVQSYDMGDDPLYHEALVFVADQGHASASGLQRRFRVGYNRAARLIEMMESEGHVAGQTGGKPRAVLITKEDAQALADGTSLL